MHQAAGKGRQVGHQLDALLREQPYARAEHGIGGAAGELVSVAGDAKDAHGSREANARVRRDAARSELQPVPGGCVRAELEIVESVSGSGFGDRAHRTGDQDVSANADGEWSG